LALLLLLLLGLPLQPLVQQVHPQTLPASSQMQMALLLLAMAVPLG
jgi:hypothetical protein